MVANWFFGRFPGRFFASFLASWTRSCFLIELQLNRLRVPNRSNRFTLVHHVLHQFWMRNRRFVVDPFEQISFAFGLTLWRSLWRFVFGICLLRLLFQLYLDWGQRHYLLETHSFMNFLFISLISFRMMIRTRHRTIRDLAQDRPVAGWFHYSKWFWYGNFN